MAFLHARHTRLPPVWIKAHFDDGGMSKGIWTAPHHYEARTDCVRHFMDVLGQDTLIPTNLVVARIK